MNFTIAYKPLLLLFLLLGVWMFFKYRRGIPGLSFSLTHRLSQFFGYSSLIGRIPLILRTAALALLIFAAARPQLYNISRDTNSPGVDIMLCLDTSGTMQALDFKIAGERVTRLAAVKHVVTDFIKKREHDRIGLVVFGTEAFTQSPLTMDKGLLLSFIDRLEIGMAGDSTAIGSAIAIGGKRLKDLDAKSKILILLTDGRSNAGNITPEQAADAVQNFGVKIYTIGVGGRGPAPFAVKGLFGTTMVKQEVDLDEETLIKIAEIGKGRYFQAGNSEELSGIYDIIDKAEKREIKVKEFFHYKELYLYFLIPAIFLLILEIIAGTVLRVIP
ncbi:MAG: VWA domain-containing protein [Spirochaetes bacterium]|nr:VWA domain-containing protein [Spirochaetota bacterium]